MRTQLSSLLLAAGFGLAIAGCATTHHEAAPAPKPETSEAAPAKPAEAAPADTDMQFLNGKAAFAQSCAGCHHPGSQAPNLLRWQLPADRIHSTVRNGKEEMPAFSTTDLSDEKLDAIVAYLQQAEKDAGAQVRPARNRPAPQPAN